MKKLFIVVVSVLVLAFNLTGCDILSSIPGMGGAGSRFDGICDYCGENESDPFYNENYTTSQRFDDTEICTSCFRSGVWMDQ